MGLAEILEKIALELKSNKDLEVFSSEYWINLRESTSARVGGGYCVEWCEQAYRLIAKAGYGRLFIFQATGSHSWLEHESWRVGKFTADGTAGQFDPNFLKGYYGFIDTAPEKLVKIYNDGFKRH